MPKMTIRNRTSTPVVLVGFSFNLGVWEIKVVDLPTLSPTQSATLASLAASNTIFYAAADPLIPAIFDTKQQILSVEIDTASITSSYEESLNIALPNGGSGNSANEIFIIAMVLVRTAGLSTSAGVALFPSDTFATSSEQWVFGDNGVGVSMPGPVRGPESTPGSSTTRRSVPYEDEDKTGEIHLRVYNLDGLNSGTFKLVIEYMLRHSAPAS